MATPFRVLIIGGGIAGLSLALILEAYGFQYELLEKHADVAPRLGAGVGLTPNGARILDQLGVWDKVCENGSSVDAGDAVRPDGSSLIHNENMGVWLEKLILYARIKDKSRIHLQQELFKIEILGDKVRAVTKKGLKYTADLLVGADGVKSMTRQELWRIADSESPGYIPRRDKTAIESVYTAVIGIAANPGFPKAGSARAYNYRRSYFFQEGREGSGEFYWWLCFKNAQKIQGVIPKTEPGAEEELVQRYASDKIWPGISFGDLYQKSIYSAMVPLQEFVLEKCFYKNVLLLGDSFRKLHPVAGQGANAALEECAFLADILWDLREKGALKTPKNVQKSLAQFQSERYMRLTALRDDGHLVQQIESLDNPVMQLMALHIVPNLQFEVAFLPQLAASFVPGRKASHLPPPKQGLCAFAPDMKINPQPRPFVAGLLWAAMLILAASCPGLIVGHLQPAETSASYAHQWHSTLSRDVSLYSSTVAIAITGLWLTESYHADYLISPLTSSVPWVLVSIYQGWHRTLPIWCCIQIFLSRGIYYYFMPRTMTDVGVARCLCPALFLVYTVPAARFLAYPQISEREQQHTWNIAHCALLLVSYMGSKLLRLITNLPSGIDAVFTDVDVPYQKSFQMTVLLGSSVVHVFAALRHAAELLQLGTDLTTLPVVKDLLSLSAVIAVWCLFIAWDLKRVNAVNISFLQSCVYILAMTMLCGPAAALAGTMSWRADQITKAKAFRNRRRSSSEKSLKGKLRYLPLLYGEE